MHARMQLPDLGTRQNMRKKPDRADFECCRISGARSAEKSVGIVALLYIATEKSVGIVGLPNTILNELNIFVVGAKMLKIKTK